jgi:outer membrane protein assembly factor BamE (lipoprotein component of BamABCDE complex)
VLAAAGLAAALLSGCATPSTSPPPVQTSAAPAPAGTVPTPPTLDFLHQGMTGAAVITQWGQPAERQPMTTAAGTGDIWIYRHVLRTNQRQVATDTRLVPVFDALTNGMKEIPEAVYSLETVDTVRTTRLLFYQDRLLEWNVKEGSEKRFN